MSLIKLQKEGDGGDGGGFDGLSDTVFTSTNAGIFTPTYGERDTKRRHRKNRHKQDRKRKKLMGKDKKSGVERLIQYLYDGSPNMSKARKMGLAPGLDDDMTGDGATAHAWNNQATGPMRLNWKKNMSDDTLNHKETSRPIEDALKTAENNEPHVNMGLAGGMETGITATYPSHSNINSVSNAKTQRGPEWGQHKSYVQKLFFFAKSGKKAKAARKATKERAKQLHEAAQSEGVRPEAAEITALLEDAELREHPSERIVPAHPNTITTSRQSMAAKTPETLEAAQGRCFENAHRTLMATHQANPNSNWHMVHGHVEMPATGKMGQHAWLYNPVTNMVHDPSSFDQISNDRTVSMPKHMFDMLVPNRPHMTNSAIDHFTESAKSGHYGPYWDRDKVPPFLPMQKSANEGTTMTSPTENKPWSLEAPQDKFVERTKENPNEAPAKDAVVKENDMQRRAKKYDNKEDEGNEPYQVEGAMATPGMGGYPSGATMQMSSFGMNTYEQDSLARGGEEDIGHDEEDIDEEDRGLVWVPEAEKVAKLESMRKMLEDEGDETPLLSALLKIDYE